MFLNFIIEKKIKLINFTTKSFLYMKFESKSLKFLEKYLNTASPTGYEQNGQKVWTEYIKPFVDEIK